MKRLLGLGIGLILGIELLAFTLRDLSFLLLAAGVALALVLLNIRRVVGREPVSPDDSGADDMGDTLRRWLTTTETTIRWSDSTRADWDRHLRPMLARRFEIATGQRQAKDSAAFHATGRMLFGDELWDWVNPNNVVGIRDNRPGPGRGTLEEIMHRLEQV